MKKIGFQNPKRKISKKILYIDLRELTFKIRLPNLPQSFINILLRDWESLLRRFWFYQKKIFFNLPHTNHILDEIYFFLKVKIRSPENDWHRNMSSNYHVIDLSNDFMISTKLSIIQKFLHPLGGKNFSKGVKTFWFLLFKSRF